MAMSFSKTGNAYTPVTFNKGRFLPVNSPINPAQIVGTAGGGQVKVANLGDAEQLFEIQINRETKTVRDKLLNFLQDSTVNYSLNTFTFTEEDGGTSHTVRLWNLTGINFPLSKGNLYNIRLTLRVEII